MSTIKKRSVSLSGHRTSYSVEDEFLEVLKSMADAQHIPLARLISQIDGARLNRTNLSSALRLAALDYVKSATSG